MVQTSEEMKSKTPLIFSSTRDFIFLLLLVFVSLVAWVMHVAQDSSTANGYVVMVFSEPVKTVVLNEIPPAPLELQGKIGAVKIEWKNSGEFRIASSTCPCKTCINYGWTRNGSIVCVPNGIVVKTQKSEEMVDAVSR